MSIVLRSTPVGTCVRTCTPVPRGTPTKLDEASCELGVLLHDAGKELGQTVLPLSVAEKRLQEQ
jgi:hypothetical protein